MGRRYDMRGRPPRRALDAELAQQILDGLRQGKSKASIARTLDLPTSTLYHWLDHHSTGQASEAERQRRSARAAFQREAKRARHHGVMVNWERRVQIMPGAPVLDYLQRADDDLRRRLLGD